MYSTVTPSTSMLVQGVVAGDQSRAHRSTVSLLNASSSASGGSLGFSRCQCLAQPPFQNHVAVARVVALCGRLPGGNLRAVQNRVAETLKPFEGGFFDDGFREVARRCHSVYLALGRGMSQVFLASSASETWRS